MSAFDSISTSLANACQGVKAVIKVAVQSRRPSLPMVGDTDKTLVVLANGPSLRHTLDQDIDVLTSGAVDTLAVNFAANAPEFQQLKPKYYVLADPHFFEDPSQDPNVERLWRNLQAVNWPMTLLIPATRTVNKPLAGKTTVGKFNAVGVEGPRWLTHWIFSRRRGMPRPRNVLIPSLMAAIGIGYRRIWIVGADHTWTRTLGVNRLNEVVSVQPHFYKEDPREQGRVNTEYQGYRLHQILESLRVAFKSYHQIEAFAKCRGVYIVNATAGESMIDAFRRDDLRHISAGH